MTCKECGVEIAKHEAKSCLDAMAAEVVMGWERIENKASGGTMVWNGPSDYVVPCYSKDISAAFQLEAEIEKKSLQHKYILALIFAVTDDVSRVNSSLWEAATLDWWTVAHASALQRTRAAIRAGEVGGE